MPDHYDTLETRDPAARERESLRGCRSSRARDECAGLGRASHGRRSEIRHLARRAGEAAAAAQVRPRMALQKAAPPFGGFNVTPPGKAKRLHMSPGPIFEPQGHGADFGGAARALLRRRLPRRATSCTTRSPITSRPAPTFWSRARMRSAAPSIPGGVGNTEQQLEAIAHLKPVGYIGTPDFLKILLDTAEKSGKDASSIKRGLVSGAALPASLREELRGRGVAVLQCYAIAETRRHRLRERGAGRHDRQRERCSSRSCGRAPAIRSPTARSARWSSPRSIPTIR